MEEFNNTDGAIMQLLVQRSPLIQINVPQNKTTSICVYNITNNSNNFMIPRNCDLLEIDKLVLTFNEGINVNEILNQLKTNIDENNKFILFTGGCNFVTIDLHLAVNLSEPTIHGNTLIINLCMSNYIEPLMLIASQYYEHEIKLKLSNNIHNNLTEKKIFVKKIYLDSQERRTLATKNHEIVFHQPHGSAYISEEPFVQFDEKIYCDGVSRGFFIGGNVNRISNFRLKIYGHDLITYNQLLLQVYAKRIGENLIYIPFNPNILDPFNDLTRNDFTGSINFSMIDNIRVQIDWLEPQTSFKMYNIASNILRITRSLTGIAFNHGPIIDITAYIRHNQHNQHDQHNPIQYQDKNKIINCDKNICNISLELIEFENRYMECSQCTNCFKNDALQQWLKIKNECPLCKTKWTSNIIYINKDSEELDGIN